MLLRTVRAVDRSLHMSLRMSMAIVATLACAATLAFWAVLPASFQANESTDYIYYYEPLARSLLAGNGLTLRDGSLAPSIAPGHPAMLAVLFGIARTLHLQEAAVLGGFALFAMAASSTCIFLLSRMIWGQISGFLAALLWMTYPYMLWLTKQPNSELTFIIVLYGALLALWYTLLRRPRAWYLYLFVGAAVACAALIRPIAFGLIFPLSLTLWFVLKETALRRGILVVALLVGWAITLAPWELRMYRQTGQLVLVTTNGPSSMGDGLTFAVNSKDYRSAISVPSDVRALMESFVDSSGAIKPSAEISALLVQALKTQPLTVIKLYTIKAARSWYATDSGRLELPALLIQCVYLLPVLAGSVLAWRQGGIARAWVCGVWLTIACFWGMTILVLSILRYMTPVIGLLFTLIPGIVAWSRRAL